MSQYAAQLVAHFRRLAAERGEAVSYRRDGVVLISNVVACPGRTQRDGIADTNKTVYVTGTDWLFLQSEIDGIIPPIVGDEILFGDKVYRVTKIGSEGHWRPSDALGVIIRISTKESPQ